MTLSLPSSPAPTHTQRALMMSALIDNSASRAAKLLADGFDVNHTESATDSKGQATHSSSLINLLIGEGDRSEIAKLFIDHGLDIERANQWGNTPLINAIRACRTDTVRALLDGGANPDQPGQNGCLPLWFAMQPFASAGVQMMQFLLDKKASPAVFKQLTGHCVLTFCVKQAHIEGIKVLLHHGQDPNEVNPATRQSSLVYAQRLQKEGATGLNGKLSLSQLDRLNETANLLKSWCEAKAARAAIDLLVLTVPA